MSANDSEDHPDDATIRRRIELALDSGTKIRTLFDRDDGETTSCIWAAEAALSDLLDVVDARTSTGRPTDEEVDGEPLTSEAVSW